jgi:hypothetical protein
MTDCPTCKAEFSWDYGSPTTGSRMCRRCGHSQWFYQSSSIFSYKPGQWITLAQGIPPDPTRDPNSPAFMATLGV